MNFPIRMIIGCGLIALGCLTAAAQQWPVSPNPYPADVKIDKPLYATIDITDDLWRSKSRLSRENMISLMQYLAKLGISRVYWMRTPEYGWSDWMIQSQGDAADAEKVVVQAAHDAGMECYAIFKPFETGSLTTILPQTYPLPAGVQSIEIQTGRLVWVSPFIVDHPEYRIQRRPLAVNPDQAVATIKLVKSDDAATGLKADNLQIWTSRDNGDFKRRDGAFSFKDGIEQREGKSVRVLTLSGLNIPADQRYIMVRSAGITGDVPSSFSNIPSQLLELYGEKEVLIPSNGDDGAIERSALMQTITLLCIRLHGNDAVPADMMLPESYGKTLETSSFNFGHSRTLFYGASPPPQRKLESANGYIVAAKGKDMAMPSPHPIYPEVREYWLSQIKTLLDHGFDGIDLRIDNHSTWLVDSEEYGFNEPVVAAYKEKFGVNILKKDFDRDAWRAIQGDAYTRFVKEAGQLTRGRGRPLDVHINGVWANATPGFDLNNLPKNFQWQWKRWIAQDLCDGVHLKLLPWPWGGYRGRGQEFAVEVIELARRYGKSVSSDARIQKWKLTTTKRGEDVLTAADVDEVIDSLSWAWRSKSINAVNLYEVFDFVHMDLVSGRAYGSPAFERILDAVKNNTTGQLPKADLQNWVTLGAATHP